MSPEVPMIAEGPNKPAKHQGPYPEHACSWGGLLLGVPKRTGSYPIRRFQEPEMGCDMSDRLDFQAIKMSPKRRSSPAGETKTWKVDAGGESKKGSKRDQDQHGMRHGPTCQLVSSGRPEICIRKAVRRGRGGRRSWLEYGSGLRMPRANCTVRRWPIKSDPSCVRQSKPDVSC